MTSSTRGDEAETRVERVPPEKSWTEEGFSYTIEPLRHESRFTVYSLRYPSPIETDSARNNTIPAEYFLPATLPDAGPPRPAAVCLHILNGDFQLVRLLCSALAAEGVPALFFKLPYYGERGEPGQGRKRLLQDVRVFRQALEQALADIRRTVDLLACRPEIDSEKIGISGISLGALVAGAAAGVEPRLKRVQMILGGGDLEAILAHARETRGLRASLEALPAERQARLRAGIRELDPLHHAAALRARGERGLVSMINAEDDNVIPKSCTLRLADAIGMSEDILWLEGLGHYTAMAALPDIVGRTTQFFAEDLPADRESPAPPPVAELSPEEAVARVLHECATLIGPSPAPGRCHQVQLSLDRQKATTSDRPLHIALIRGHGGRFRLEVQPVPEVETLCVGRGSFPWMLASNGTVFAGELADGPENQTGTLLGSRAQMQLRVASGVLSGVGLAPSLLARYVQVDETEGNQQERHFHFRGRVEGTALRGTLAVGRTSLTPKRVEIAIDSASYRVAIHRWNVGAPAPEELFAPPRAPRTVPVSRRDLHGMFRAIATFAMDRLR